MQKPYRNTRNNFAYLKKKIEHLFTKIETEKNSTGIIIKAY